MIMFICLYMNDNVNKVRLFIDENIAILYISKGDYITANYMRDFIPSVILTTVPVTTKEAVERI